jgi:hypothetical protein
MRPYRLGPSPRIASGDGRGRRFFTIAAAPLLFAVLTPSQAGWTSIRSVILVTESFRRRPVIPLISKLRIVA